MGLCKCTTSSKNTTLYTTGKCLGCEAEKAFYEAKTPEIEAENAELQPEYEEAMDEIDAVNVNLEDI